MRIATTDKVDGEVTTNKLTDNSLNDSDAHAQSQRRIGEADCDDDDPVVHEIPVYLSRELMGRLHLLQYPMRPAHMPYDMDTVVEAKVKPHSHAVQLTMAIDTTSTNYNKSRGSQIAVNANANDAAGMTNTSKKAKLGISADGASLICPSAVQDEALFPSGQMDKMVLESTKVSADMSNYALGILGSNELHITPLTSIAAMRPTRNYLDAATSKKAGRRNTRQPGGDDSHDDDDDGGDEGGDDELKAVTVRFASSSIDDARRKRERRSALAGRSTMAGAGEQWMASRFHRPKSEIWEQESQMLFCNNMDNDVTAVADSCESGPPTDSNNKLSVVDSVQYFQMLSR